MNSNCWETEINEDSTYKEVKEDYDEMIEELDAAGDNMFPNGWDYEA